MNQALTIAPDDPVALRVRGDIYKAMGKTDEAIADYRRALELDPFQSESRDALVKLDQEVPPEQGQPLAPPVADWVIKEPSPGRYIASSSKYPKVRAELEMFGAGKPKILEWSLRKDFALRHRPPALLRRRSRRRRRSGPRLHRDRRPLVQQGRHHRAL